MANDKEARVTLKLFNQEFNAAIKETKGETTRLNKEFELQKQQMKLTASEAEQLSAKVEHLNAKQELAARVTRDTEAQYERIVQQFGANSKAAQDFANKVLEAQIAEQKLANEVATTSQALERAVAAQDNANTATRSLKDEITQLDKQYQLQKQQMQDNATETEQLGAKLEFLNNKQGLLRQATQEAATALEQAKASYGDNSREAQQMANKLLDAQIAEQRLANEVKQTSTALDQAGQDLNQLGNAANDAEQDVRQFGAGFGEIVVGLAAGGGIAGAAQQALDTTSLNTKIDITFDVPEESKATVKDAVMSIEAYGVDAEAALEGVRRQWSLNGDASDATNRKIAEGAAVITSSYGDIDFTELIQETNEISSALKISDEEALALVNTLLKTGFPPDQLDIIAEYGTQLEMAGFNAEEVQAIMAAGVETGTWNIDNLLDGLKEGRIKLAEFGQGVDKSTTEMLENTSISKTQLEEWGQAVAAGGEGGTKAMKEVAQALASVEDETKRNELGVALFGTMWEDQGSNITDTILNMDEHMVSSTQNVDQLNDSISQMDQDPTVMMKQALADLMLALEPVLLIVADVITKIAEWVSENTTLSAILATIGTVIGVLTGLFAVLTPAIGTVVGWFGGWGSIMGIVKLALAALTGPVGLVIAGITALIAIGIALYQNWDVVSQWLSTIWEGIVSFATATFEALKEFFVMIWDAITQTVSNVWQGILDFLVGLWEGIVSLATATFEALKEFFVTIWDAVTQTISNVWQGILAFLTGLWEDIASLATSIFEGIKTFFTTIFETYKTIITNAWNAIKLVTQTVFDAIKAFLTMVWEAIKSTITNLVNNIKTTISTVWETIKSVTQTVFNTIKSVLTTIWTSIKSTITNLVNGIKTTMTNVWNTIKSTVSNIVNNIWTTIKNIFTNMVNSVSEKMNEVKRTVENIWKNVEGFFKGINLVQIGKDIIQGLINGISQMTDAAIEAVTGVVDGVINKAKSLLGIKSPSRVFAQIGRWVSEGWAIGIEDSGNKVINAVSDIALTAKDIAEHYRQQEVDMRKKMNAEIAQIEKRSAEDVAKIQNTAYAKKRKTNAEENIKIQRIREDAAKKITDLQNKTTKEVVNLESKMYKSLLEETQRYINDKKSLDQLNLVEEAHIWKQALKLFEEGSAERIKAQQEYKKATDAVNKETLSINNSYMTEMQKIIDNQIKQEEALTKVLTDELTKRESKYKNFAGTFDAFTVEIKQSGQELTANLKSQVNALDQWQSEFAEISNRGVSQELLDELSGLGVKALPQLLALNQMTDEQLEEYSEIYEEKSRKARLLAEAEVVGMKLDTEKQILALREASKNQLSKLQTEWDLKIKSLTKTTASELSSLNQIGIDAGQGLLNGLASMEGPLVDKAREIANAISQTISSALQVNSPSKLTTKIGEFTGEGLVVGMDNLEDKVKKSALNLARTVSQNISNIDQSKTQNNKVTVVGGDNNDKAIERALRRLNYGF